MRGLELPSVNPRPMPQLQEPAVVSEMPRSSDLLAAIVLLTRLPLPRPERQSAVFGRATLFFPLVGLLIGAPLVGLDVVLASYVPRWLLAAIVIAAWESVAATPLRLSRRQPAAAASGVALHAGLLITKAIAVAVAPPAALLFAPMLARWAMVVLAVGARDADAPGRKFNAAINFREFALTSVFAFAVVFAIADALGVLVVLCVAALTLVLRLVAHRRWGGVSWQFLMVSAAVVETFVVGLLAML